MHSRFVIVVLLIVALLGLAMHTAADTAHATNVTHGDCGGEAADGSADSDADGLSEDAAHCCGAACHVWAPLQHASGPLFLKPTHESTTTETVLLASADGDGLRRPPRTIGKHFS